ncbi:MAG: aminoacyl--tRNA ligase-related protein, partial [Acidimicrobiales bacterium]
MIDIRLVRNDLAAVKTSLARKKMEGTEIELAAQLDSRLRELTSLRDDLRARVKSISKQVGLAMRVRDEALAETLAGESRRLGGDERTLDKDLADVESALTDLLLRIPNLPAPDAPDGGSADDNVILRVAGHDPSSYGDHQRVPHWEIGARLGILDLERAAKISGSMFAMYRGLGATLARALCQLALDHNADAFEEIRPPTLVRTDTLTATGQLPKFADDAYRVENDDLWAIPTAEVPLTSLARDEILSEADLPTRLMAYTPCYRREAGSAGRDTRGMLRTHEFDKVEV